MIDGMDGDRGATVAGSRGYFLTVSKDLRYCIYQENIKKKKNQFYFS